jgi:lipopolysaccharide biosynthesis glycosyltransferase
MEEADSRRFLGSLAHYEEIAGSGTGSSDVPVVIFVADDHYAMPLAAAISSVVANLGREQKAHVFIVDGGISRTNKEKIMQSEDPERVRIQWLQPSESHCDLLKSLPCGYVGRTPYYKMLVPDLLGPEYPRIIYLDCDVIVEADITDLWVADLGENSVLAVQDLINPFVSSPFGLRNWRELGRKADDELFNTGVLVLNAAKWHKENVALRLVQYLRDHYQYVQLCDQDAMNAVFRDGWGRLDSRWNVLPYMNIARNYSSLSKKSHENLLTRAYLLHYCGPNKPWNARCRHPQGDRFFHYLDMTAWSGWRPKWWAVDSDVFVYYMRRVLSMLRRKFGINNRSQVSE